MKERLSLLVEKKKCKQGTGEISEGKRPLRRTRRKCEDNIKIYMT
jgi:hypothetical protein